MIWLLLGHFACNTAPEADDIPPEKPIVEETMPATPATPAERHTRNLRFRDNKVVFNESARWLDLHRDEGLPVMFALLAEQGPAAIGIARVLGKFDDPRAIAALEATLDARSEPLAFEGAKALAKTSGDEAGAALRRGAASEREGTVIASLCGIEIRADSSLCDAVRPHLEADEPIRAYALRVWGTLKCGGSG